MDNTQNLGQPVGKVTTTYNGEKIQVNVYADRSVILPDGTVRRYFAFVCGEPLAELFGTVLRNV